MKEITDPGRIGYHRDEADRQCLAVDVEGLVLEQGETIWVWVHKPERQAGTGHRYPNSIPMYDCATENSIQVDLAGKPISSRSDKEDSARLWIPLAVPSTEIGDVRHVLLPTDLLDLPGWGWVPPA